MSTIAARIQKTLAEQIINGELKPGHKLDEQALATLFGASRTPVREALRELGARGLVEIAPRQGGVVSRIGIDRLTDMLDAECELEALCARLAAHRMTAVEKGQLQEIHEQSGEFASAGQDTDYLALNQAFHNLICDGAHNATLAGLARDLRERLAPFRQSQSNAEGRRLTMSHDDHGRVVEAILDSDADAAYGRMRDHNARLSSNVVGRLRRSRDAD